MNKNTQALHEALVSLWRKLGEKTLLKLKEQQYEAVRKIVVDNRPQKRSTSFPGLFPFCHWEVGKRPWHRAVTHGGHKRQQIRPRTNNFLSLVWNITKLSHRIELAIPKNPIVFVFRFCYILAGK